MFLAVYLISTFVLSILEFVGNLMKNFFFEDTLVYVPSIVTAFINFDAGMQLLGIRQLIKKDPETQNLNTKSFILNGVVMIILFCT
jgi:hypothetical protein